MSQLILLPIVESGKRKILFWKKVGNFGSKNLYQPCDQIKIEGTNVHDQIAFYAFHLCQACIILQLGDGDCMLLLLPTIKYYFCISKKDKYVISLN